MALGDGLAGRRILIVEDELLIADELATIFNDGGAEVMGPAMTVTEAIELINATDRLEHDHGRLNLGLPF
jgi:DNA-binding response OmpR family regulator